MTDRQERSEWKGLPIVLGVLTLLLVGGVCGGLAMLGGALQDPGTFEGLTDPTEQAVASIVEEENRALEFVDVSVEGCFGDVVRGTATNNGDITLRQVYIGVYFINAAGESMVHEHSYTMTLRPGDARAWQVPQSDSSAWQSESPIQVMQGYQRCRVEKGIWPRNHEFPVYEGESEAEG